MANKKQKKTMWVIIAIIAALFIFGGLGGEEYTDEDDDNATGSHTGTGGGGGGGSSSGGETTPPDGGFECVDCETVFLEGNPGIVAGAFREPSFWQRFIKPKGHWNCLGTCIYNGNDVSDKYNCVLDPTNEIPENGYDDITGERPDCWCLPKSSGPCNFYDANYGEGIDNLQCGGSCPVGATCNSFGGPDNNKFCECTTPDSDTKCGFHLDGSIIRNPSFDDYERACYGSCDLNEECEFWLDQEQRPQCGCGGYQEPKVTCDKVDVSDGNWGKCWTQGVCNVGNECVYNQYTQSCGCQSASGCGWHITIDQAKELQNQFSSLPEAIKYILSNWQLYCYGTCSSSEYCQYFQSDYNGRTIHDCKCGTAIPDDFGVPIPTTLPVAQLPITYDRLVR